MTAWKRAIILVDMDAFFASIEQLDFPELRGKPVAVTNGEQGTCIITASYEARQFGIKTGVRLPEAKRRCPSLCVCPSRPKRYAEISSKMMKALKTITPDIEIFSIDEAFLDVTRCQKLWGDPVDIAKRVKRLVESVSGVTCSVGVSGDKTTAKFAAKQNKPNGLTVIHPKDAKAVLSQAPVTDLCGIGKGIAAFLKARGVVTCGDMDKLPIGVLAKRFGNLGRRLWYMCQGEDPDEVHSETKEAKSIGHGKIMPPNTRSPGVIKTYLQHMCEKVSKRLRDNQLEAQYFFIGFRLQQAETWLGQKVRLMFPTKHGHDIFEKGLEVLDWYWQGEGLSQVQVTALDLQPANMQPDLFADEKKQKHQLDENVDKAVDQVNERYGDFALMPASLLSKTKMHDVIAPAWQPEGSRKSV